jgi:H+/gluconate symporter-like permease
VNSANIVENDAAVGALFLAVAGSALGLFAGLSDADGGATGAFVVALVVALLTGSGSATVLFDCTTGLGCTVRVALASALALMLTGADAALALLAATGVGRILGEDMSTLTLPPERDGIADPFMADPGGPATTDGAPPFADDDTCSSLSL